MSKQVLVNLRQRLLCSLDAVDVLVSAGAPTPASGEPSADALKDALALASYSSDTQRRLQACRLLGPQNALNGNQEAEHIGVVVEFGGETGVDALAAYSDGIAAWFDAASGSLTEVTLAEDTKPVCQSLMAAGVRIGEVTGAPKWDTPPAPSLGFACISLITRAGISFGMGPMRDIAADGYGGPIIHWALQLRSIILSARQAAETSS